MNTGKCRQEKNSESEHLLTQWDFLQFLTLKHFQRLKFLKVKVFIQQNKLTINVPCQKYDISQGLIEAYWWKIPSWKANVWQPLIQSTSQQLRKSRSFSEQKGSHAFDVHRKHLWKILRFYSSSIWGYKSILNRSNHVCSHHYSSSHYAWAK